MEDTSGFYKLDPSGALLHGPNFVVNAEYSLYREQQETYAYPIDGWYWFNTEAEAREFVGLPAEVSEDQISA